MTKRKERTRNSNKKIKNKKNSRETSINTNYLICDRSSTVFGYTEPGAGKKKFECQDTYCIIDLPEDHLKYYAVYDGHGNVGRSVSLIRMITIV